jgi:hypothetical protein
LQFHGERWPGPICSLSLLCVPRVQDLECPNPIYIAGDTTVVHWHTLCANSPPFGYVDEGVGLGLDLTFGLLLVFQY